MSLISLQSLETIVEVYCSILWFLYVSIRPLVDLKMHPCGAVKKKGPSIVTTSSSFILVVTVCLSKPNYEF